MNHNKLNTNTHTEEYEVLTDTTKGVVVGAGRHPRLGHEMYRMDEKTKSLEEVEKDLINDTDRLIAALDGTGEEDETFLEERRRYPGPVDGAIYLDKSARPVRALVSELWNDLSEERKPVASFLNIDKENWLYAMGYSQKDFKEKYIDPSGLTLDKLDPDFLVMQLARLRSLYFEDDQLASAEQLITDVESGATPIEELKTLWDIPTKLDGKHVAIVDEVKSTKATLKISDMLLREAVPDADFEAVFFSTPQTFIYDFYNTTQDEMYKKITDTEKPIWYNSNMSDGRGGVENRDETWSQSSSYVKQRLGKFVLSVPFKEINGRPDERGRLLRDDFKKLAQKFREGKVANYVPAYREDFEARIEKYYGMNAKEWAARRRQGESMQGVEQ